MIAPVVSSFGLCRPRQERRRRRRVPYETITLVLGLQGWFAHALTVHRGREARIHLERNLPFHVCALCGTKTTKRYDHSIRELRDLSLSGKAVYLYVPQ